MIDARQQLNGKKTSKIPVWRKNHPRISNTINLTDSAVETDKDQFTPNQSEFFVGKDKQTFTASLSESVVESAPEQSVDTLDGYESDSEPQSDCEIIEVETPIIVLDDDINEPDQVNEASSKNAEVSTEIELSKTDETTESICATICDSTVKSPENSVIEVESPSEPAQLFFVDKNPNTNFEAPIYDIASAKVADKNANMASKPQNIRITFGNTHSNFEKTFTPNPLLSSTRLNASYDDSESGPSNNSSSSNSGSGATSTPVKNTPTNFHISINSTCENGSTRTVSAAEKAAATTKQLPNSSNDVTKSRKRKAQKENREDPPSKKSSTDIIVLNDTISDEDSVVFVSETANVQKRNRIADGNGPNYSGKAADFISLRNGTETQRRKSVSNVNWYSNVHF